MFCHGEILFDVRPDYSVGAQNCMARQGMPKGGPASSRKTAMPPKHNPLKLNTLQLKTLTLLQAIARIPGAAAQTPDGEVVISQFPNAHGDHFHLGDAVVAGKDATGLFNEAVWNALTRKGVARAEWPRQIALTAEGLVYETGLADEILHKGGH
jgi:hypothetical protein